MQGLALAKGLAKSEGDGSLSWLVELDAERGSQVAKRRCVRQGAGIGHPRERRSSSRGGPIRHGGARYLDGLWARRGDPGAAGRPSFSGLLRRYSSSEDRRQYSGCPMAPRNDGRAPGVATAVNLGFLLCPRRFTSEENPYISLLDFLFSISRPNRDLSTGYAGFSRQEFFRAPFLPFGVGEKAHVGSLLSDHAEAQNCS